MPFKAESIDAVTGHSVLYLLADPAAALAECWRVLRPGGRLLVMEPNDRSVRIRELFTTSRDPRFLLSVALWRPVSWLHRRFGPESLRATLEEAGFGRCQISETLSGLGSWPTPASSKVCANGQPGGLDAGDLRGRFGGH